MRFLFLLLLTATIVVDSACERKGTTANAQSKPLEVSVAEVQQKDVPLYREWIGTLDGSVNAEIKAQVSGYLVQQEYTEGSFVKAGQLLFQIDSRPFQAELDQAEARLAQSQGQLEQARAQLAQPEAQVATSSTRQSRLPGRATWGYCDVELLRTGSPLRLQPSCRGTPVLGNTCTSGYFEFKQRLFRSRSPWDLVNFLVSADGFTLKDRDNNTAINRILRGLTPAPQLTAEAVLTCLRNLGRSGGNSYQLGGFPAGWSEWNGSYRDTVRQARTIWE
jgi:hypothetical protein